MKPLGDRVLVKVIKTKDVSSGGIILLSEMDKKTHEAKVIEIGNGRLLKDGTRAKISVKKDDIVLIGEYSGVELKIDNEQYLMVCEKEILAIFKEEGVAKNACA